ncbi:unnamed protein product [Cyclocybe aegerita]|uniref:DUF6533 domain-containing protein n=1 Tax=Cyclocybe aegerita TaxID=1973307 RepID=A0A8S0WG31_CYCAE|nr:unnamed protein product [Cyclocybe aegerita]
MSSPTTETQAVRHLLAGKYFQIASFVMLIYDHGITFSQEVERIWRPRFSGATLLFLINRYLTAVQFIIMIDAFHDPAWPPSVCKNFVKFEGASAVALISICELTMILRVYALYGRSAPVLIFLLALLVAQITISAYGVHLGFPVPSIPGLPDGHTTGCILTSSSNFSSSLWIAPLVTDSCLFALTLWRARRYLRNGGYADQKLRIVQIVLRDGTLYFFVIFLANLMNTMIYFLSSALDLKAIGASFSQLLTSVMVSRLVLNLRSVPLPSASSRYHTTTYTTTRTDQGRGFELTRPLSASFLDLTLNHLGEEVEDFEYIDIEGEGISDRMPVKNRQGSWSRSARTAYQASVA